MTKMCLVTKMSAGFNYCRLFLYLLTFSPTLIVNTDFFYRLGKLFIGMQVINEITIHAIVKKSSKKLWVILYCLYFILVWHTKDDIDLHLANA